MPHGTEHHLEEAEHAQHAAHDAFTRRVAMTMAIVAATLAGETLLSHRAHNATLSNQIKANDNITERANVFGRYQAKKNRQYQAEANAQVLAANAEVLAALAGDEKLIGSRAQRLGEAAKKARDDAQRWKENAKKWKADAEDILKEGNSLNPQIKKYEAEAENYHHRSDFFDMGELGVELALVLCSVAVLTRGRAFWYAGIAVGAVGLAVAVAGFFVGHHAPGHPEGTDKAGKHEEALLAPALGDGGGLAGAAPAAGLDEAVDAQQHEHHAQAGHRGGTDAGNALRHTSGGHAPHGGQEADEA